MSPSDLALSGRWARVSSFFFFCSSLPPCPVKPASHNSGGIFYRKGEDGTFDLS